MTLVSRTALGYAVSRAHHADVGGMEPASLPAFSRELYQEGLIIPPTLLTEEVVQLFDTAFRDVASEFERLFSELFPGGEGKLSLTDPADLLHSGIEIEARPGRKRVKRISLLSGGERALTALGFLFSIFRARPSPFYLLDEVEAALDDVNLHRFLGLIKDFAATSQVLVVTHQKRTMEAADMLYGVSMARDGSSRVVSQKLDDVAPAEVVPIPVEIPDTEEAVS